MLCCENYSPLFGIFSFPVAHDQLRVAEAVLYIGILIDELDGCAPLALWGF